MRAKKYLRKNYIWKETKNIMKQVQINFTTDMSETELHELMGLLENSVGEHATDSFEWWYKKEVNN